MSDVLQVQLEEIEDILDNVKKFVIENNSTVKFTQYYIPMDDKTFLQVIEETLNDPSVDNDLVIEYSKLMSTLLEKGKVLYSDIASNATTLESSRIMEKITDATRFMGFSGDEGVFSELENLVKKLEALL